MRKVQDISINQTNRQEIMNAMKADFPYISTYSDLDKYPGRTAPWHWHESIELFYVKTGTLEYNTPQGKTVFTKGQEGILNTNVLHKTLSLDENKNTVLLLHIFKPEFLFGKSGNFIDKIYIAPFVHNPHIEIMQFTTKKHKDLVQSIKKSFELSEKEFGFPLLIRSLLSEIWLHILQLEETIALLNKPITTQFTDDKLKSMMVFVHEHYCEKISIADIANSAFISERECFRTFKNSLQLTPLEYLQNYRIQKASYKLKYTTDSITSIGLSCGFSSSSYFGKIFKEYTNHNPFEYRMLWQNIDTK